VAVLLLRTVLLSFTSTTVRTELPIGPYSTANTPNSTVLLIVGQAVGINNKIREVISEGHNDKIRFVNIDPYVGVLQRRFCESGINEPAANRQGLLFYNQFTLDGPGDP
jgi:hypothetical protein